MKPYKVISMSCDKIEDEDGLTYGIMVRTVTTQDLVHPFNIEHHHIKDDIMTLYALEKILETGPEGFDEIEIISEDFDDDIVDLLEFLLLVSIDNSTGEEKAIRNAIDEVYKLREN
jgi:hypothetical protein